MDWYSLIFQWNAISFSSGWLSGFLLICIIKILTSKFHEILVKSDRRKSVFKYFFKCSHEQIFNSASWWEFETELILAYLLFFMNLLPVTGVCQSRHKWIPGTSHLSSALPGVRLWRDKGRNSWLNNRHKPSQGPHTSLFETLSVTRAVYNATWRDMQLQQGPLSHIPSSIKIPLWRRDRDGLRHPCHQGLPRPYNVTKH